FSRAIPIKDASGAVRLIRGFSQDVTERRAAEAKLRRSQELLAHAEEMANLGSWELGASGETRMLSENLFRIIGEDPQKRLITVPEALERMEAVDAALMKKHLSQAMAEGIPFAQEVRYHTPDGRKRIFYVRGAPVAAEDGKVARIVGITRDVTEQRAV